MPREPGIAPTLNTSDVRGLSFGNPTFQLLETHEGCLAAMDEELLDAATRTCGLLEILDRATASGLGRKDTARYWRILQEPSGRLEPFRPASLPGTSQLAPVLGGSRSEPSPSGTRVSALQRFLENGPGEVPASAIFALLVDQEKVEDMAFGLAVNSIDATRHAERVVRGASRRGWSRRETEEVREAWASFLETWAEHFVAAFRRSAA